ncbi:LamG-like jellyroll fold domain-containing protein [Sunxiuqinia sp. sy24]|uniref:LamG-like jellyroll fold domain-containing protein n=1 Tax=Sunxiuqinia sp. sy24 TaxID=3461495 RepID=UPI0040458DD1
MNKALFLSFIACLFVVLSVRAQRMPLLVDDFAFPCTPYTSYENTKVRSGNQAFLLELDQSKISEDEERFIKSLAKHAASNQDQTFCLAFTGDYIESSLSSELTKIIGKQLFTKMDEDNWPTIDSLHQANKNIIALFNHDLCFTTSEQVQETIAYTDRFSANPLNKIVVFKPQATDSLYQECLRVWQLTGKVPNLILCPAEKEEAIAQLCGDLNSMRRFKAIFWHENQYLNEIFWKNRPGMITPAKLSSPLTEYEEIFSPYKNGFKITPGEVIHHTGLQDTPREFIAYTSSIEDKLSIHFPFDKEVKNRIDPAWNQIISHNATIEKDKERGYVLHLTENNSFIDYAKANELNFDTPISISTWIKADSLRPFMGIIGLGTSFSLKLNMGFPDFTTPTIKDHLLDEPLALNQWYHIAVVFNPNTNIEFYIDGEKRSTMNASEILPSDQSIIIGNNIWGEQFYGSIDELKIWDRGLSKDEIKGIFLAQKEVPSQSSTGYYLFFVLFAVAFGSYWIRQQNKRKTKAKPTAGQKEKAATLPSFHIQLFGNFQFHTEKTGNITERFSPLLRQLLAFCILNTPDSPEGISVKKITDTFWPGMNKDKAKENRGANIKKLRKLLDPVDGIEILYKNKRWYLQVEDSLQVDYFHFTRIKLLLQQQRQQNTIEAEPLQQLLHILRNGNILPNLEHEWLDSYKTGLADEIIAIIQEILPLIEHQSDLAIQTAKTIFKFDPLHEEALKCILQSLSSQGNHGQAQQVYEEFCKRYVALYNEEYPTSYTEISKK